MRTGYVPPQLVLIELSASKRNNNINYLYRVCTIRMPHHSIPTIMRVATTRPIPTPRRS